MVDVSAFAPDLVSIDTLARLRLRVRRLGRPLELRGASDELRELVAFVGLRDVLALEPRRQAEEREQAPGIEEERDLLDPAVADLDDL